MQRDVPQIEDQEFLEQFLEELQEDPLYKLLKEKEKTLKLIASEAVRSIERNKNITFKYYGCKIFEVLPFILVAVFLSVLAGFSILKLNNHLNLLLSSSVFTLGLLLACFSKFRNKKDDLLNFHIKNLTNKIEFDASENELENILMYVKVELILKARKKNKTK